MSRLDPTLEPKAQAARRIEVITGAGGRRRWSDEEKARARALAVSTITEASVVEAEGVQFGADKFLRLGS